METNSGLKVKLISRQRGFNFENLTILDGKTRIVGNAGVVCSLRMGTADELEW